MEHRKPDLTAPRAKMGVGYCPVHIRLWRRFKRETGSKCSYRNFTDIIKTGNSVIADVIAHERDGFRLMNNIGTILLVSCPAPTVLTPYNHTGEGKHQNWETDRRLCDILFMTYGVKDLFLNRKLWEFTAIRDLKRSSSKAFLTNHTLYKKVQRFERPAQVIRKEKRYAKELEEQEEFLKDYNDFELCKTTPTERLSQE